MAIRAVRRTVDFERIEALPRREITLADSMHAADVYTPVFRRPNSKATLKPSQAIALHEAAEAPRGRGIVMWYPVGEGKTLALELLPAAFGYARGPAVLITDGVTLRDKTYVDRRALRRDWVLSDPPPVVVTAQELCKESRANFLMDLKPRVILLDEGDVLANPGASVVLRLIRYLEWAEENDYDVRVVVATGTPSRLSIMAYHHLLVMALGEGAPIPLDSGEAQTWANAIDVPHGRAPTPTKPGPLGETTEDARAWYAKRLLDTPGLLILDTDSAGDVPLTIRQVYGKECPRLDAAFKQFLTEGEAPGGAELVTDSLSRHRLDGQIGTGFVQIFKDPQPPELWKQRRRAAAKVVRAVIESSQNTYEPLDTEKQVYRKHGDTIDALVEWREIEPTYTPVLVVRWLSKATVQAACEWLEADPRPSIVWCGSKEFLAAMQEATGLRAYGPKGQDIRNTRGPGASILTADPARSFLASWHANKKGLNLQPWRRGLVTHMPQSAKWLEQLIGRHHRGGQLEPVEIDVLMASGGTCDTFARAWEEAAFAKSTVSLTQKLLRARIVRDRSPAITPSNRFRWARGDSRKPPKEDQ